MIVPPDANQLHSSSSLLRVGHGSPVSAIAYSMCVFFLVHHTQARDAPINTNEQTPGRRTVGRDSRVNQLVARPNPILNI